MAKYRAFEKFEDDSIGQLITFNNCIFNCLLKNNLIFSLKNKTKLVKNHNFSFLYSKIIFVCLIVR